MDYKFQSKISRFCSILEENDILPPGTPNLKIFFKSTREIWAASFRNYLSEKSTFLQFLGPRTIKNQCANSKSFEIF